MPPKAAGIRRSRRIAAKPLVRYHNQTVPEKIPEGKRRARAAKRKAKLAAVRRRDEAKRAAEAAKEEGSGSESESSEEEDDSDVDDDLVLELLERILKGDRKNKG
ncbi:hypothetical protein BDZ45DRAFT_673887 [Acephala macrosclerotiorum]|nr:hypothetical protein BDZ45DRAFT_673887 [Acephala macrosclerotiorum]